MKYQIFSVLIFLSVCYAIFSQCRVQLRSKIDPNSIKNRFQDHLKVFTKVPFKVFPFFFDFPPPDIKNRAKTLYCCSKTQFRNFRFGALLQAFPLPFWHQFWNKCPPIFALQRLSKSISKLCDLFIYLDEQIT